MSKQPNITEIITKIILRNDVSSTWENSTIVLEKGEPALEIDLQKGVAKFKIGDGKRTFKELPYSTSTPEETQVMIDEAIAKIHASEAVINTVKLESGSKPGTLKLVVNSNEYDNIAVTGLGSAAFTDATDYATASQGKRADRAMEMKGIVNTLPEDVENVGESFKASAEFTIPANKSFTGSDVIVTVGDIIVCMADSKWLVISSGTAEAAKTLTKGISATVSGAVTGTAEAVNAGETMNIVITKIDPSYLNIDGNTLILNGGSAAE